MYRSFIGSTLVFIAALQTALGGDVSTDDFETGHVNGEPLRKHRDWFFEEQNADPTFQEQAGVGQSGGVAPGDRAFTWIAHSFDWNDAELVAVVVGGDWQTDSSGRLDDDRAGWTISNNDDSSDNIFGVQIDPVGTPTTLEEAQEYNIEAYWDGDTFGDNEGRTSIIKLPQLKPNTWFRLRAKFTKLTPTSAKIDVTFVELDDKGNPIDQVHKGTLDDTSSVSGTAGNAKPNRAYFTAPAVWPVFKNYLAVEGGFDNAYFEVQRAEDTPE